MPSPFSYFLSIDAAPSAASEVAHWFAIDGAKLFASTGLVECHRYRPHASADPYVDDGPGPVLLLEFGFPDALAMTTFVQWNEFVNATMRLRNAASVTLTHDGFETRYFPVAGETEPFPRFASVSYVVRYYRPAEDEKAFQSYYVNSHPPILGRLPKVRNVLCYLPVTIPTIDGVAPAQCMLGNEVVFDSLDDLNAALASEVRDELRNDFHTFPPFSGRNTHYAMDRERVK
ncbi:MAG: EthD family reductase [Gammaproteobacteria bacterium]|nr:EthD family reductase [Gammaproteobacteria bacterium]